MAIKWGDYVTIGGVRYRTGVDLSYSPTSISGSTSTVTVTTKIYLGIPSTYQASGSNLSWSVTGSDSGSGDGVSWLIATGASSRLIATLTETVTLTYGATKSFSASGRIRPIFSAGTWTPTVTASITIPARPVSKPAAPTGFDAARSSDTRQNLTWSASSTASAPIDSFELRRREKTSTGDWGSYVTIASALSGSARSYADTATRADRTYQYALRSRNASGVSGFVYTDAISTTPATPAAPTAKKSGTSITVTRPPLSPVATHWQVRDNGGAVLATVPASTSTWTHASPDPTITHAYQVQAVSTGPTLYSGWSPSSATVQLQAPPNAPTWLAPTGAVDATVAVVASWQHNPVDTTDQDAYELGWSTDSVLWTTTGKVLSPDSMHTIPAGTWTNGTQPRWRVRTWGDHADPSQWSEPVLLNASARPVAGISNPTDGGIVQGSSVQAAWSYFQADGSPYSAWELELLRDGTAIHRASGRTTTSYRTPALLEDGASYTLRVRVRSGAGLWSAWESATFAVDFAPPPTPTVEAVFHADSGYTTISVDVPEPAAGEVPVESISIHRASGAGWVLIEAGLQPGQSATDRIPLLGQAVQYRATAVSALPSTASSAPAVVDTTTHWVFFNYGPGFGQIARIWGNLTGSQSAGRTKTLHHFSGRENPTEFAGQARSRSYSVTGRLFAPFLPPDDTSLWDDFQDLAFATAPVCVRDPEGTRLFCSVGEIPLAGYLEVERTVTVPLTIIDWAEDVTGS